MDETTMNIIEGRKTFFIVPDVSLLPDSYLEDYMSHGYEAYFIADDRMCPLDKKIEALMTLFTDSIFFFYIDSKIQNIDWPHYISYLQKTYGNHVLIGVLYAKRENPQEKTALEKYYLFDVGIQCGCISLEYQKDKNFALIDKVLFANQAVGRRKNVRAIADNTSKVGFDYHNKKMYAKLVDISLSHFSCIVDGSVYVPMYEKISDIYVEAGGLHFITDGIVILERSIADGKNLIVFVFVRKSDGQQGLEWDMKQRLSERIYTMITDKVKNIMQLIFHEVGRTPKNGERRGFTAADLERLL